MNDASSFEDLLNLAEMRDFLFRAQRDMFPKMQASALSLVIGSDEPDAKLALEVGAAVLFDKPLLLVIPAGRVVSASLRRAATEIVEVVRTLLSLEIYAGITIDVLGIQEYPDADPL